MVPTPREEEEIKGYKNKNIKEPLTYMIYTQLYIVLRSSKVIHISITKRNNHKFVKSNLPIMNSQITYTPGATSPPQTQHDKDIKHNIKVWNTEIPCKFGYILNGKKQIPTLQ